MPPDFCHLLLDYVIIAKRKAKIINIRPSCDKEIIYGGVAGRPLKVVALGLCDSTQCYVLASTYLYLKTDTERE